MTQFSDLVARLTGTEPRQEPSKYCSIADQAYWSPPPYYGPEWIGKPIGRPPEPVGPDWIGKRIAPPLR